MARHSKAKQHERFTLLFPRVVLDGAMVEGDRCPMRKSKVEGRADREIRLDGLCASKEGERRDCRHYRGVGPNASVKCAHPNAKSDFGQRRLEAMGVSEPDASQLSMF